MSERTRNGAAPLSRKRPTAYDVARLAGVSQSMVSRAFTPGASVSAKARAKVVEAARTLNYRPNLIARSLITQQSHLVAVAIAYLENQFYPVVLQALSERFAAHGYRIILFTPGPDGDPDPILDEVLRLRVAAVVLASTRMTSRFAEECAEARVPVVLLNRRTETVAVSSVTGQNRTGAKAIGSFLIAGGHAGFAYVAGLEDFSTSQEREQGFREALHEAGASLSHRVVGHYDFAASQDAARTLLSRPTRPEAVFCANDHTAFAVMQTARSEFGLQVGRDVSIIGFDDVGPAAWPTFELTTFSQPVEQMVGRVVALVLERIERRDSEPVHEVVAGRLIVRKSARIPRSD